MKRLLSNLSVGSKILVLLSALLIFSLLVVGLVSFRQTLNEEIEPLLGKRLEYAARTATLMLSGEKHEEIEKVWRKSGTAVAGTTEFREMQRTLGILQRQNELTQDVVTLVPEAKGSDRFRVLVMSADAAYPGRSWGQDRWAKEVIENGIPLTTGFFRKDGALWISGLAPIETKAGGLVGVLRLDYRADQEVGAAKRDLALSLSVTAAAAFLLAMTFGVLLGRNLVRPIRQLADAARQVSAGKWDVDLGAESRDETGVLRSAFRQMLSDLKRGRAELEDYSKNLERKVEERTVELHAANRLIASMLDSLGQGYLVMDQQGVCLPVFSKACISLLETEPPGKPVWDVLRQDERKLREWMQMAFDEMIPFKDLVPLAPRRFQHSDATRVIELDYQPIRDEAGRVQRIMVISTDRTREAAAMREAEAERLFSRMVVSIAKNREAFRMFLKEFQDTLDASNHQIETGSLKRDELFRQMHTLKGGAGVFGLESVRQAAHRAEDVLAKGEAPSPEKMRGAVSEIADAMNLFLTEQASWLRMGLANVDRVIEVREKLVIEFGKALAAQGVDRRLIKIFHREFLSSPAESAFAHFDEVVQQAAEKLGKVIAPIEFENGSVRVLTSSYAALIGALVHAFRNAVDHGVEEPGERVMLGKSEAGKIQVRFAAGERLAIEIVDDGRGVDPSRIRAKLKKLGRENEAEKESDEVVIQHIFDAGFSTRESVTEWSGRGVGMDAIRTEAEKLGGSARVISVLGQGSRVLLDLPHLFSPE